MPSTEVLSNTGLKKYADRVPLPQLKPMMSSTTGSAPLIAELTEEEHTSRPYPRKIRPKLVPTPTTQSINWCGSPSNVGCFQQRYLGTAKPILPLPRASSADTRGHSGPWTASNSPTRGNLIKFRKETSKPTSSELSLCSSPGNGPDEDTRTAEVEVCKGEPHAIALYDFDTRIDGDLHFKAGDIISLQEAVDETWYRGRSLTTGQVGIFPLNHVNIRVDLDTGSFAKLQTDRVVEDRETKALTAGACEPVPTSNKKFPCSSPVGPPALPIKPDISFLHRFKGDKNQLVGSSTPPVILSLRPRSHTTVSQLAHTLEQRGIAIGRGGAKASFPPTDKQSISTWDALKAPPWRSDGETRNRPCLFPTPQMVKTPLVLINRESSGTPGGSKPSLTGRASNPDFSIGVLSKCGRDSENLTASSVRDGALVTTVSDINLRNRSVDRQKNLMPIFNRVRANGPHADDTSGPPYMSSEPPGVAITSDDRSTNLQVSRVKPTTDMHSIHGITTDLPEAEARSFNSNAQSESTDKPYPSENTCHNYHPDTMTLHPRENASKFVIGEQNEIQMSPYGDQWLLVLHDYTAVEPVDLTVKAGHVIRCLTTLAPPANLHDVDIPDCWLHCVSWFNVEGQVPSTYVRRILDSEELDRWMQCRPRAKVMYEFNAEADGDLELKVGDLVYLHEAIDANWYRGENAVTGHKGMFPAPFVRVLYPL